MVSKNLKIGIGVMVSLFLLFGCLGSGSENDNQVKTENVEVAVEPTETAAAPETPDQEWLRTSGVWYIVIGQDMDSLGAAASSGDLDGMYRYAKQARGNINNAKRADSKLSPSAKFAYAHSEYLDSLEDIGDAMDLIISCGDGGWTDINKITEATELMENGKVHVSNFGTAIKTA